MYFCGERCGEVSWVLVGALVQEVDERLQEFTRVYERLRAFGGLSESGFAEFYGFSGWVVSAGAGEAVRVFTRVHERLARVDKCSRAFSRDCEWASADVGRAAVSGSHGGVVQLRRWRGDVLSERVSCETGCTNTGKLRKCRFAGKTADSHGRRATRHLYMGSLCGCGVLELGGLSGDSLAQLCEIIGR